MSQRFSTIFSFFASQAVKVFCGFHRKSPTFFDFSTFSILAPPPNLLKSFTTRSIQRRKCDQSFFIRFVSKNSIYSPPHATYVRLVLIFLVLENFVSQVHVFPRLLFWKLNKNPFGQNRQFCSFSYRRRMCSEENKNSKCTFMWNRL